MTKQAQATNRMDEIANEIGQRLDNIQSESLAVGALLIEAKQEFEEVGKKQSDFLSWCSLHFAIGKAQVYKLIKVSLFFGEDERFKGVSMRVLYALASSATEEQLERAADFAANGSLTTAIVNQLLNPEPVAPKAPTPAAPTDEEQAKQAAELQATLDAIPEATAAPAAPAADAGLMAQISELTAALSAANEMIKSLQAAKVTSKAAVAAPFLPQFRSAYPYAVLGLAVEQAGKVTVVKKAFRELIKCGYGEGHEAFNALVAAKDALLADIEAAK